MSSPGTNAREGGERCHQFVHVDRVVPPYGPGCGRVRKRMQGPDAGRCQTETIEVGVREHFGRRKDVRQPKVTQLGNMHTQSLDYSGGHRGRAGDAYLLSEDRPNSHFEGIPRARRPEAGTPPHKGADKRVLPECIRGRSHIDIEIERPAHAANDVDESVPAGKMCPHDEVVVPTWFDLYDPHVAVHVNGPPIGAIENFFNSSNGAARHELEHQIPLEWSFEGNSKPKSAVGSKRVRSAATRTDLAGR